MCASLFVVVLYIYIHVLSRVWCVGVLCCVMLYGLCCGFCKVCACTRFNAFVWHVRDVLCEVA